MSDNQTIILNENESYMVPEGYVATVEVTKLAVSPKEVLERLLEMDKNTARVGDISDLQRLARAALASEYGLKRHNTRDQGLEGSDSQVGSEHDSGDSDA